MSASNTETKEQSIADETTGDRDEEDRKDLDDADRTDEFAAGHYSREEVTAMCHATEGQSHD